MIVGNTFTLGAIRVVSKGSLPCVLGHMFIDAFAVIMLVESNILKIMVLVAIEIVVSITFVSLYKRRKTDIE